MSPRERQAPPDSTPLLRPSVEAIQVAPPAAPPVPVAPPLPVAAPAPKVQPAVIEPEQPEPQAESVSENMAADHLKTGWSPEVPYPVLQKIARLTTPRKRPKRGQPSNAEILLNAIDHQYEQLDELVAKYKAQFQVVSPVFGVRTVQPSRTGSTRGRFPIRPTYREAIKIDELAEKYGLSRATFISLVLVADFELPLELV